MFVDGSKLGSILGLFVLIIVGSIEGIRVGNMKGECEYEIIGERVGFVVGIEVEKIVG